MGKRRKQYWRVVNFNKPSRKRYWSVCDIERFPHDSKRIFKAVCLELEDNCGRQLEETMSRGFYSHWQRSRDEHQNYYNLRRKGNSLVAYKRVHLVDGEAVNLFLLSLTFDGEQDFECRTVEILRKPIGQWKEFIDEFKALTPELSWLNDEQP